MVSYKWNLKAARWIDVKSGRFIAHKEALRRSNISKAMRKVWRKRKIKVEVKKVIPEKKMWRCTMTVNVLKSGQRGSKTKCIRCSAWSLNRDRVYVVCKDRFKRAVEEYVKNRHWQDFNEPPNEEITEVAFDEKLIDTWRTGQ